MARKRTWEATYEYHIDSPTEYIVVEITTTAEAGRKVVVPITAKMREDLGMPKKEGGRSYDRSGDRNYEGE